MGSSKGKQINLNYICVVFYKI